MVIKTYTSDSNGKIYGISYQYANASQHTIRTSNNALYVNFTTDASNADQAKLYTLISFGSNVTGITKRCCYKFINLKSVSFIGEKVTFIDDEAFYMCKSLASISIPKLVQTIGANAFAECISLEQVEFPKTVISIGDKAFFKSAVKSINVNLDVSSGQQLFASCQSLQTAIVDGRLCVQMFEGCSSLKSVIVKCSTKSIPLGCFKNCTSLDALSFEDLKSIEQLNDEVFSGCSLLNAFAVQDTSVSYIGKNVFAGTSIIAITLPATIASPSQLDPACLGGSMVNHVKFMGIDSEYMESHKDEFSAFGGIVDTMVIESSDGQTYKVDVDKLIVEEKEEIITAGVPVYIISIAISENIPSNPLDGMYKDTQRFINLINKAYATKPELIRGITRLNDSDTPDSNGLGTLANLDKAFDDAKKSGAQFVIFHFSDHGERRHGQNDGYMYLYNGTCTYEYLYSKLQQFEYAFVFLCCCYPNSTPHKFNPGENQTKALFWCAGSPDQATLMQPQVGHNFMTIFVKCFDANCTWEQQWTRLNKPYSRDRVIPYQYNYNEFPVSEKVFRIGT